MDLKDRTEGHKRGGLVGRAGPNVQRKEKGCKGLSCLVPCDVEDSGREGRGKGSRVVMSCLGEMRCDAG